MPSDRSGDGIDRFPSSFDEVVGDGIRQDLEFLKSDWSRRTTYGRFRLLPILVVYPVASLAMIGCGIVLFVLFRLFVALDALSQRLKDARDRIEPEVYDE
ncbi:hypothetical protein [Halorubrum sp. F4]|uniref:hypothetical protein n=1 Tax=Halorubrum sp. F4 TaxID=2989715 RepID=UPI00247FEA02|nr:hypothetical protein [Halorubrum sp. F4]